MIYITFTRRQHGKNIFFLSYPTCLSKERIQFFSDKTNRDSCHFVNCPGFKNNMIFHICQNAIPARWEPRLYNAKTPPPWLSCPQKQCLQCAIRGSVVQWTTLPQAEAPTGSQDPGDLGLNRPKRSVDRQGEIEPVGFKPRSYKIKSPSHWLYIQ